MAQTSANVLSSMLEYVDPELPMLYEKVPNLAINIIAGKAKAERVSDKSARVPLDIAPPGQYRTWSPDGGAMGRGSGYLTIDAQLTYFSTLLAIEINYKARKATETKSQAVASALERNLREGLKNAKIMNDISFHSSPDGNSQGIIGYATAQSGGTTYTFADNAANGLGVNLFRNQMKVHVFDVTLATFRTSGGAKTVIAVDYQNKKITLDSAVTGAANTDVFIFDGVTSTPSWKYSMFYHHNDATTGTWLNLNRATYPMVVANSVDAGSSLLLPIHGMLLDDKIIQARSEDSLDSLEGFTHMCQAARLKNLQLSVTEFAGNDGQLKDIVPRGKKKIKFCDHTWWIDKRMPRTRMDLCNPSNWAPVSLTGRSVDFYRNSDGQRTFTPMSTTDGSPIAADLFFIELHDNFYNRDPQSEGFVKSLGVESGY
jgi:hypothetical protein